MKVYTYFEPVPEIDEDEQRKQIAAWAYSWRRYGWEPTVLGRKECDGDDPERAAQAETLIRSRPSANAAQYTVNTSMRWLAFQAVGGGLQTDYDVVNVGLTPGMLHGLVQDIDVCTLSGPWVPCAVYAMPKGCQTLVARILEHPDGEWLEAFGRTHISDMGIFRARPPGPALCLCREYGQPANPEKPLVHCSNGSIWKAPPEGRKGPRSEVMARVVAGT